MKSLEGNKLDRFITKGRKKLRYGYTTGSCAAAASKAATLMLYTKNSIKDICIDTPKGWQLKLSVIDPVITDDLASCCIIKDSGDDPDVTNGIRIYAAAKKINSPTIEIEGGVGIGMVTKAGLSVSPGQHAINPAPMRMIIEEVEKVLPKGEGVKIKIYAPEGVAIAKKTFNPKLGIVGGISIIGTTGIVEPMSEEAMKESLALELSVLKEKGVKRIIFSPGNYGRDYTKELFIKNNKEVNIDEVLIKTSNFIGYMLDKALEHKYEEIMIIGHLGKMVKVAGGIFHTHSSIADGRMEVLAANCGLLGCSQQLIAKIMESITTDEAVDYIMAEKLYRVFDLLAEKITQKATERTFNNIKIGTLIFTNNHDKLGLCSNGNRMLEEYWNE
ncbi:cobalamin biosynthesis protein CbiD [Alkaliphilus pronyensis]|uniref:Cobalt-precorrin-5B C(1)-methyltransferase n=1 Tax=Alkaliphilus pronyensis TaxID=1482732 RepID=A0A6I0FFI6_9FIRM|nr:cobalt-precorrin-5B (C(1))-methyltransferase CbiD [Alkaliphilus pronyensis]KAB3539052.1 cobalamin biosynthesis protein CbiD [Alkaliphilus pronyensis]